MVLIILHVLSFANCEATNSCFDFTLHPSEKALMEFLFHMWCILQVVKQQTAALTSHCIPLKRLWMEFLIVLHVLCFRNCETANGCFSSALHLSEKALLGVFNCFTCAVFYRQRMGQMASSVPGASVQERIWKKQQKKHSSGWSGSEARTDSDVWPLIIVWWRWSDT